MSGLPTFCGFLILTLPALAHGADLNTTGSSNCTEADFDLDAQLADGPSDYFTVAIDRRNITRHPCVFEGQIYAPSFVSDHSPGEPPFALRVDFERRLPDGMFPPIPPLIINPGQAARQTFRWRTTPQDGKEHCLQPDWMSGPVLLVAPSLLKRICSGIEVSRFSLAPLQDSAPMEAQATENDNTPQFELTSGRSTYYEGEIFPIHVSLVHPGSGGPPVDGCPTFYLKQRSPDGTTRIDAVRPLALKGCRTAVIGHRAGDWQSGFELDSGANSRWGGLGEHDLEIVRLAGSADDATVRLASSNVLKIQFADPSTIARKWGQRVKGIAADISLDKDTFQVGENVPLHLAVENFGAEAPVYGWDPSWDPCKVVKLEILNASGQPLSDGERFMPSSICTGHGLGPRPYAKGKVVPMERTLRAEGLLPNHPGTYLVVVDWAPTTGPIPSDDTTFPGAAVALRPYATVHAAVIIHVVGEDAVSPK